MVRAYWCTLSQMNVTTHGAGFALRTVTFHE